jgi:DNA topoisomerase-2
MTPEEEELAKLYQMKTPHEHILARPDTYIGGIKQIRSEMWVVNKEGRVEEREVEYIPGWFKFFDESIVNCRDHMVRCQEFLSQKREGAVKVTYVQVTVDQETGTITMQNDGTGLDILVHPITKLWIPEMIVAHLHSSTNYDDNKASITGGKNGLGLKALLVWSTWGLIETVDHVRGLKYVQEFRNNLSVIGEPSITKVSKTQKPYTKISFRPDYARLTIPPRITDDVMDLLRKRTYDISAVTEPTVKVSFNGGMVPVKNFKGYMELFLNDDDSKLLYESPGPRWEIGVARSPNQEFMQVSLVNGICTSKGGEHVKMVLDQITSRVRDYIELKKKTKVSPASIKEQLMLFVRCDIINPAFESQTKDFLNTPPKEFGSTCVLSDKFIEKIATQLGVMESALRLTEAKELKTAKKTDGKKTRTITGIPKLTDANWAGTEKSRLCVLIFCEGDSAKSGIISGLSAEDRDTIGVYPLKGKLLNVRDKGQTDINKNKEIDEIKKILGLQTGHVYKDQAEVDRQLRYSRVIFLTDQDLDGSHIKGLCINLFHSEWESLTKIPGFIGFMNTPILKASRGHQEVIHFYNEGEYERWKAATTNTSAWTTKYYKGLGTSSAKEWKEYLREKKFVGFTSLPTSGNRIDLVFNKKRADERKEWLIQYDRKSYVDTAKPLITYDEFIDKEMIHFSNYDCDRNLPNLMDGLKTSQRKVLFAAFKKGLTTEIKVAQFAGYVSEHSSYHHGETSLCGTIVSMAQDFTGSNNLNLLEPDGQFGTRLLGGKDSASERYIYTRLSPLTRHLFSKTDDEVLEYLQDDGVSIEPKYYAPVIPMVLINGSKGIGTGFSTDIMCYNPRDIFAYLRNKLTTGASTTTTTTTTTTFVPWYRGFQGKVEALSGGKKFVFKGCWEAISPTVVRVTELPVGMWTQEFKEYLDTLLEKGVLRTKAEEHSTDTQVGFTITFTQPQTLESVDAILKLTTTGSTSNMHLFDAKEKLVKYDTVQDIIDAFIEVRLPLYETRRLHQIQGNREILCVLSNKLRFIRETLSGAMDLRQKRIAEIDVLLESKGYDKKGGDKKGGGDGDGDYRYLTRLPMDSVTHENVAKLEKETEEKQLEVKELEDTNARTMWLKELENLEQLWNEDLKEWTNKQQQTVVPPLLRKGGKKIK